jgi:bloom syndrome protein
MMDKKEKFSPKGISTNFVGEDQMDQEAITNIMNGEIQLVYISPESLICNPKYRNMLLSTTYQERLVALVVDEAHCVKMWLVIQIIF